VRTIGILGGMGPAAAADFYVRIVSGHGALRDQDHPPCILYSATQVPDRTAFLLGGGVNPAPELVAAASLIEAAGADFIAMPCNSAHAFLPSMRAAVGIPILDMIALAAAAVARVVPQAERIGLLATSGTVEAELYDKPLRSRELEPLYPDVAVQQRVMEAIKEVKAGGAPCGRESDARLVEAAAHLSARGADCIIMGCTEVPLALATADSPVAAIDGNQVLVDTTLALAIGRIGFEEITHAIR
jgi:aspartate racemase